MAYHYILKPFFPISNPILSLINSANCPLALFSNIIVFSALLRRFFIDDVMGRVV